MNSELNEARSRIAGILGETAEPLEVLQRVEEHRLYWRPLKSRVILLAESHVYTSREELLRTLRAIPELPANMPRGFVRLVYALGYGEDTLLDEPITSRKNSGSPQYWKIFQTCATVPGVPPDFTTLLVSHAPDSRARMRAKVGLLSLLQERGIWLVDASVAALYRPGQSVLTPRAKRIILQTCWDFYTRAVLEAADPKAVLCIGVGVARALRTRLDTTGIPWAGVPQPQAHLSAQKHREIQAVYAAVCADPNEIKRVPAVI
jgi:hypothetical protein